ncbi:MAG: hypothetical protein ABI041_20860, partial [Bdellovibrionia bacterium]
HPLIGDTIYGDGLHNRFFRDKFNIKQLYLKAFSLKFTHPDMNRSLDSSLGPSLDPPLTQLVNCHCRWNHSWIQVFDMFGVCPYEP